MNTKKISFITSPPASHMVGDGFNMHNFIPGLPQLSMQRTNPFILLDYNAKTLLPSSEHIRGVGVHPHRGFETVSIVYHGKVAHTDSTGGGGVIGEGEVQWMTAASGILHKEFHESAFSKSGGNFQMVQLWINLPAKFKKEAPKYQSITKEMMPEFKLNNSNGKIEVISGEYKGIKGAASTFSPIHIYNAKLKEDETADFSFPASYNTILLVIEGSIQINEKEEIETDQLVLFENKGENFKIKAKTDSIVLVLSAQPIKEPIVAYGPFVMNNKDEIIEAINDYNLGKFGYLE